MMDSYKLRQEAIDLQRGLDEIRSKKEVLNRIVEDLHQEQMKYLKEIPVYKKQASDAEKATIEPLKALDTLKTRVAELQKQHDSLMSLIIEKQKILSDLKINKEKVNKETEEVIETVRTGLSALKEREALVSEKEKDVLSKEENNKKISFLLDRRETALSETEKEIVSKDCDLQKKIDEYNSRVELHQKKVDAFIEQKQFLSEDQQILKQKTESANKLIKDNSEIKAAMLKQSEKMDSEIKKAEQKQVALDRAINDLKNEEKRIKIMELKVFKMAKDANIEKELKDLMESLK